MSCNKITDKENLRPLITFVTCLAVGFFLGWLVAEFQKISHPDDLKALTEARYTGNLWIGGICGFLLGLIKSCRG